MRVIARFEKGLSVRYISHLDLQRLFGRALRRSDLPIAYSQGYHPHPVLSFASALALGAVSVGEYLDIAMERDMEATEFQDRLNAVLPEGVRIHEALCVPDDAPAPMSRVRAARYTLRFRCPDAQRMSDAFAERLADGVWRVTRVNKRNETRDVDIIPDIFQVYLQCDPASGMLQIECLLASGSSGDLAPLRMVQYVAQMLNIQATHMDLRREELYARDDNDFVPLSAYYAR